MRRPGDRRGSSKNLKPRQSRPWRSDEEEARGARGRPTACEGPAAAAARGVGGALGRARAVSAGGASSRHPPRRERLRRGCGEPRRLTAEVEVRKGLGERRRCGGRCSRCAGCSLGSGRGYGKLGAAAEGPSRKGARNASYLAKGLEGS